MCVFTGRFRVFPRLQTRQGWHLLTSIPLQLRSRLHVPCEHQSGHETSRVSTEKISSLRLESHLDAMDDRYVKSVNSQCTQGVETYLSDAFVLRRDSQQPNFFLYGTDARSNRSIVEIHSNGFDSHEVDDEEDEENVVKNTVWSVDPTSEITAGVFDENTKQIYLAVEQDQSAIIYKISVGKESGLIALIFVSSRISENRLEPTNN